MKIQKSISMDEKIWKTIDEIRNSVPRSAFVSKLISDELKFQKVKGDDTRM